MTYGVSGEKASGSQCSDVPSALHDIDGVYVVGIDAASTADSSQELGEDVDGHFAPWEVSECRESNGDL